MSERPSWQHFQEQLREAGFRPSRRFGQNFLLDENMLEAIARDARITPGQTVLEVGPGLGFLTRHLLECGAHLVCAEIDERLLEIARSWIEGPEWVHGDVLAGKHRLAPAVAAALPAHSDWQLVSNLPYSVAAPLLGVLADLEHPPSGMTVLVQREVAERIAGRPGSSDWGLLSIVLQCDYTAELVRHVPPQLFWPRPEVDSSVVRLVRKPDPLPRALRTELIELCARLFQRRRQTLGRVLGEIRGREAALSSLAALGWEPSRRAEELDLRELLDLCKRPIPPPA
ncbi:MAG: ribosomal RNA small subunit methyltransferase A [Planctomycetes bacterium]|nr:ribosomal RNA small subunit methyltransferase A [Planctomycetota bacterium]